MLDAFGKEVVPPPDSEELGEGPFPGDLVANRYRITAEVEDTATSVLFRAQDVTLERYVTLKRISDEHASPNEMEPLLRELLAARSVSHPNVCRVHDVVATAYGTMLIMQSATSSLRRWLHDGEVTAADIMQKGRQLAAALQAIHATGLVHGELAPDNVLLDGERVLVVFGVNRSTVSLRQSVAVCSAYSAPERMLTNFASPQDDVYALAVLIWEMMTGNAPQRGLSPRGRPLLSTAPRDFVISLPGTVLRVLHRALSEEPLERPSARDIVRALESSEGGRRTRLTRSVLPGPPPAGSGHVRFQPGEQSVLVLHAASQPGLVGRLVPLTRDEHIIGRHSGDIELPESTLSSRHARMTWQDGCWIVEDLGSSNGIYASHDCSRKDKLLLRHGDDIQLGALCLKLVRFQPGSVEHWRARRFVQKRDGLTGLLVGSTLLSRLEDDSRYAEWIGSSLQILRFCLRIQEDAKESLALLAIRTFSSHVMTALAERGCEVTSAGFLRRRRLATDGDTVLDVGLVRVRHHQAVELALELASSVARVIPDDVGDVDARVLVIDRPDEIVHKVGLC